MMASQSYTIGRHFLILVVSVAFALASITCSDNPVQPGGEVPVSRESSIIPLAVGNEWRLKRTQFALDHSIENIVTITYNVDSVFVADGRTWYHFNPDRQMSVRSDGLHLRNKYFGDEILWRRYPAVVGDTTDQGYVYLSRVQKGAQKVSLVVATDTLITVPAGSFKCIAYQIRYYDNQGQLVPSHEDVYSYTDYLAPGVGFVLTEQYALPPKKGDSLYMQFRVELIHATLH